MLRPLGLLSLTRFFGGGEVYCERLCSLLSGECALHALVQSRELHERLSAAGAEAQLLDARGRLARLRVARHWLEEFAREYPGAVVILNGQAESNLVTHAGQLGLRAVVVRHTDLKLQSGWIRRWVYRRNAKRANAVVCVSHIVAAQHSFVPAERVHVIPHWLTATEIPRENAPAFRVLYVGRVERDKGIEELLRAAEVLRDIEFSIVGEGGLLPEVRSRNLPNVHLFGFAEEPSQFHAVGDLLVLPSHSEGSSLVVLEAMAAGVPCLVSDIPALREIAAEGSTAALFPCGDASALAQAILSLRDDPERRAQLRKRAVEWIATEHSPAVALERYRVLLRG